jgi:hypothetical protein
VIKRIRPSEAERNAGTFSAQTLEEALQNLRTDGTLILEDVVDAVLIEQTRQTFLKRYAPHLNGQGSDEAVEVGERRLMITVNLEAPFSQRELFANSWLFPILNNAFQGDFVLDAYGVVCSLASAPSQHIHQDGVALFPQAGLNLLLPMVAVTVAIPLLEMNELHGTTALWPGSHRDEAYCAGEGDEPVVREGACVLWDYRLRHGGTPNRSSVPRPLLYMTYCRPWFVDHKNYGRLARPDLGGRRLRTSLRAPKGFLREQPEHLRRLLARVEEC